MEVIVACRVNRKNNLHVLDMHRYKARPLVENFFQRMKVFRRMATAMASSTSRFWALYTSPAS